MKVTQVNLEATRASLEAGRPSLTPELLAATGARYSRSNDGLEAILSKIDPQNPDKSVDSIFRMVDYGHASISDMAPVAMFMDGISMWLAYHIWSLCPLAGGQESSTRYIKLSMENLPNPEEIGIPEAQQEQWLSSMNQAFDTYEKAIMYWESVAQQNPNVTRIPKTLLEDTSDKACKQVARMKRNYAFDRARYFLPAALKTNVMIVQSARAWVSLCQQLLSHPLPEPQRLGELIREELSLVAPRLVKHAKSIDSLQDTFVDEWKRLCSVAKECSSTIKKNQNEAQTESHPKLEVWTKPEESRCFVDNLKHHDNRYAPIGVELSNTPVRFGWNQVTFGDIRDLNRHRTGTKRCVLIPWGFYGASDQTDSPAYQELSVVGAQLNFKCFEQLVDEQPTFIYHALLGSQFSFEHTTTANHFIYEAELRTGVGAHYRYAKHLHDVLELWYQKFPETRGLILEGSAEPE